ncbi:MAG: ABC transporter ATP-binding protein [Phycisphaeraceae bacterium]|nr:ABC transporter ATP-binding protein [Phycisphaeraceae bacterium]
MSEQPVMIEAQGLSKYYGRFTAVEDLSFSIRKGEVVAFLGPNGAGKSTTMKLLTGYLAPSRGTAKICGHDVSTERIEAANKIGYLPENGPLYQDMTPTSLLKFFAEARGLSSAQRSERLEAVIGLCNLQTVISKPIRKLSRGYRQRVGMAMALLHDPDVLILDEPTSGLDPNQIRDVREMIRKLGQTKTIMLSTHILQEVKEMTSRVLLIHDGRLRFDGPVNQFAEGDRLDERFRELTRSSSAPATETEKAAASE